MKPIHTLLTYFYSHSRRTRDTSSGPTAGSHDKVYSNQRCVLPNISRETLSNWTKGRQYFDSGDYALSAASKADDSGLTQTGTAHPLRESISRPYAPVPTASNISKDAYKDINVQKSPSPEIVESPLHQRTNASNNKTEGNEDEQQATAKALNMTDNTR